MDKNYKSLFDSKLSKWNQLSIEEQEQAVQQLAAMPKINLDPDTTSSPSADIVNEAEQHLQNLSPQQLNDFIKSINPNFL